VCSFPKGDKALWATAQFWVGVPSEYPGIKPEIYDAFNANPYGLT
jgi:hypothetical protein